MSTFRIASTEAEIDKAFSSLSQLRADALVVAPDAFFIGRRDRIVALAANHATPTIYPFREFAVAGGLMSYGANLPDLFRQAGIYAGRILKGTRPADLPAGFGLKANWPGLVLIVLVCIFVSVWENVLV